MENEPKVIHPDSNFLEMINKILNQNNEIIKINKILIEKLSSPYIYMPLDPGEINAE